MTEQYGESFQTNVAVVGAGYIGYPLALLLAFADYRVLAVDTDITVVSDIERGVPRLGEPGIAELASDPTVLRNLRASTVPESADVFIIAVPTPLKRRDKVADLSMVEASVRSIVPHVQPGSLVIVESTVPPNTTDGLVAGILAESGLEVGNDILLAHCPERLHPGSTLDELRQNDRIVGGINKASTTAARILYEGFVNGDLLETDSVTAELCKLFENTYRDVNIALTNQMAYVAERLGVDPLTALTLASLHPRVDYLQPSIGVGGHCIPIDPWFVHQAAPDITSLIVAAREVNRNRESITADRIMAKLDDNAIIVLAGVAYKPNVSDSRESPALAVAYLLRQKGIDVRIYDPLIPAYDGSLQEMVEGADLLAITVPHTSMIESIRAGRTDLETLMRRPQIVDFSSGDSRPL